MFQEHKDLEIPLVFTLTTKFDNLTNVVNLGLKFVDKNQGVFMLAVKKWAQGKNPCIAEIITLHEALEIGTDLFLIYGMG